MNRKISVKLILEIAAVVISLGSAIFAFYFAKETNNLQSEIRDIQFRPYVGVEELRWGSGEHEDGVRIQILMTVINTGLVPAKNIRSEVSISAYGKSLQVNNFDDSSILMGGGSKLIKATIIDVSTDQFSLLQKEGAEWVIAVKIRYDGLFSNDHPYEQDFQYDPLNKQFRNKGGDAS